MDENTPDIGKPTGPKMPGFEHLQHYQLQQGNNRTTYACDRGKPVGIRR